MLARLAGRDLKHYFPSWRCGLRTKAVRPVRRSLSRSALRSTALRQASSTFWLTTM
jgi:hypothetical protein